MSQIESGSRHGTPSQPPNSLSMLSDYSALMARANASHYSSDQYQQQQRNLSPHANYSNSVYNGDCSTTYTNNVSCGAMPTSSNQFVAAPTGDSELLVLLSRDSSCASSGFGTASSTGNHSIISLLSRDQSLSDPESSLQVEENDQYECEECSRYPSLQRLDTGHSTKVVFPGLRDSITGERYKSMIETKRKMPKQTAMDETSGKNAVSIYPALMP